MFAKIASDRLLKSLDKIQAGTVEIALPNGRVHIFQGQQPGPHTRFEMRDWRVAANLALRGDIGFADDYRNGLWESDNLENLVTLSLQNQNVLDGYVDGSLLGRICARLIYMTRKNSLKGSQQNIPAHYDLGNDFYSLWLDQTMSYSSALYKTEHDTLEQAQSHKYNRMLGLVNDANGSLLEIGCGWGGLAEEAAQQGYRNIKGITLSHEQRSFAQDRLRDQADIVLEDYRNQAGLYDSIVSIEMLEAVGERYWPVYFAKLKSLLKKGGKAAIQTITIGDAYFDRYRAGGDFIRSYIFPGGMLPSPGKLHEETTKAGLIITDSFSFGHDYAKTLQTWLQTFDARYNDVKDLGYDDGFIRLWRLYLAACASGFNTGRTDVVQLQVQHV